MNDLARWITLQDPTFAVPLQGAVGRIVKDFGLSAEEAGQVLQKGMATGAIALQNADTGAVMMPSLGTMAKHIDWATGCFTVCGQQAFMLVLHWPDVERIARGRAPGPTIEGEAMAVAALALPAPEKAPQVRAAYSESALAAWFMLREHSWPAERPTPNEAADMEAARRHFDSIPARDEFRRIRQAKTSETWRKPGPRNRR